MDWIVKRIQEDDYGCVERPDNRKVTVLVTLTDEKGQERLLRVEDDWLYAPQMSRGTETKGPSIYSVFCVTVL